MIRLSRFLLWLAVAPVCAAQAYAVEPTAFVAKHCLDCHGADEQKAGMRLDRLTENWADPQVLERWVALFDRVEKREMPPHDAPQPAEVERTEWLAAMRTTLKQADRTRIEQQGRAVVRRMNRTEYEHTLRDLLALPLLRVKELLPEDGQEFGFDKVAGALDISPVQMTKYLLTADIALRQAIVREPNAPETKVWREPAARQDTARSAIAVHCAVPLRGHELAPGLKTHIVGNPAKDFGNTYRAATFSGDADSVALLTGVIGAHQPEGLQIDRFRPTVPGWYRIKFSTWSLRWQRTRALPALRGLVRNYTTFGAPYLQNESGKWEFTRLAEEKPDAGRMENVEFYGETEATQVIRASLKGEPIGYFDAPSLQPKVHEFRIWLNPGERVSFHAMTLPAIGARNSGANEGVRSYEGPAVAFDWFEAEGPLVEQWPPASQRRLFGEIPINAYPRPLQAGLPTVDRGSTVALANNLWKGSGQNVGSERLLNLAGTSTARVNGAAPGKYEIAVTAFETPAGDEPAKMRILIDGKPLPGAAFNVAARRDSPKTFRATLQLESAGPVEIGVEFLNDFFDESADPMRRDRNLYLAHVAVTGPKADGTSSNLAARKDVPDVRELLARFADCAFRRPVEGAEIEPYAVIVETLLQQGMSFEESMLAGYKGVLCSPDFLFIGLEGATQTDYALASRLSYFLWNSLPDDALFALAKSGELNRPEVLRAQVERMLSDPRSDRFVEHFLDEWLEMKKIDFTTPDPQLYPEFDPWLRDSMLAETRAYFRKMLTEDRGVDHLIASDFVVINQRLAELYGIRGVNGAEFRTVPVPAGSHRGGFLTQASVLKVTANGTATSPVLRGVWVIERLLGIPRQPPPPNVPAVEPDATGAVTIRQMIEKHRADPACASCHAKMDPPGMALESFDVIGGFRDRYRLAGQPKKIRKGKEVTEEPSVEVVSDAGRRNRIKLRLGSEVDSSGELADGRRFSDVDGLRRLLLAEEDSLARNIVRQLTIYATGAGIGFSDRDEVENIVKQTREQKHGLRSIVHAVVAGSIFSGEPASSPSRSAARSPPTTSNGIAKEP
jgi:hypothetical protein